MTSVLVATTLLAAPATDRSPDPAPAARPLTTIADVRAAIEAERLAEASSLADRIDISDLDAKFYGILAVAHTLAGRWAHGHRLVEQLLERLPDDETTVRAHLEQVRKQAESHLVSLSVELAAGDWVDGGRIEIALDDPDKLRPWLWSVADVRANMPGWPARLSAGEWTITLTTPFGAQVERVTVTPGSHPRARFAPPPPANGRIKADIEADCLSKETSVRVTSVRVTDEHTVAERRLPASKLAMSVEWPVPPGTYTVSLGKAMRRLTITAGVTAPADFTCRAPPPSRRPLWGSLAASGVVAVAAGVLGGVGQHWQQAAIARNAGLLDEHMLTGDFNVGACQGNDGPDACAMVADVESKYSSDSYHHELGRGLQLRASGLGLGAAAIGLSISGLPVLARSPAKQRQWLIADGVIGALLGIGGAALIGWRHPAIERSLDGFDSTGVWRANGADLTERAQPWLAGSALVGAGSAMLVNTIIFGATLRRTGFSRPTANLRASVGGFFVRF